MYILRMLMAACLSILVTFSAAASEPTAEDLIKRYDQLMSPNTSEATMLMVAHRQDGTTRSYKMRMLKGAGDKLRTWFLEPASAKGQEMLRVGDNMWVYMPNLKRALRLASRDSFQGGDFNNGDVMRVNYRADYRAKLIESGDEHLYAMELVAKSDDASYSRVKLWMSKDKKLPVKAEYYAASGKMLRSATFGDVKLLHGVECPTHIVMRNELVTKRYSDMFILDRKISVDIPAQAFVLDSLGQ